MIIVTCRHCQSRFPEQFVEITDIEEDILGRDVVTFKCKECGRSSRSHRLG